MTASIPTSSSRTHRLAFVITELEPGGAERCLTNLVLGLDRSRFAATVYSLGSRPGAERLELVRRLEAASIPVHFLDLQSPRQFLTGIRRLGKLLAEQRPELLQSFLFHANVLAALAGRRWNVPQIVLGMRVADRSPWRMRIERHAARFADCVVCVSQSVGSFARDQVRLPAERIRVIPNGILPAASSGVESIDSQSIGVPSDRRLVVVVGRLHWQKGCDWLLAVAPRILTRYPDVDLMFVGHGPEESNLRRQASESGCADRIHFLGWRPDVPAILRRSSLLVLPSRWEGMPNVVLEAMAAQLPVVATSVEGVAELLGPAAEPQMVDFGDDEMLLQKVASILQDPAFGQELGGGNLRRVEQHFSLASMIAQYERLYEELLGRR